jgi:hypothetical protein
MYVEKKRVKFNVGNVYFFFFHIIMLLFFYLRNAFIIWGVRRRFSLLLSSALVFVKKGREKWNQKKNIKFFSTLNFSFSLTNCVWVICCNITHSRSFFPYRKQKNFFPPFFWFLCVGICGVFAKKTNLTYMCIYNKRKRKKKKSSWGIKRARRVYRAGDKSLQLLIFNEEFPVCTRSRGCWLSPRLLYTPPVAPTDWVLRWRVWRPMSHFGVLMCVCVLARVYVHMWERGGGSSLSLSLSLILYIHMHTCTHRGTPKKVGRNPLNFNI